MFKKIFTHSLLFFLGLSLAGFYIYKRDFSELSVEEKNAIGESLRPHIYIDSKPLPLSAEEVNYYESVKKDLQAYKDAMGTMSHVASRVYADDDCSLHKFDEGVGLVGKTGVLPFELNTDRGWQKLYFVCPCPHMNKSLIVLPEDKYIFLGKEMGLKEFKESFFDKKVLEKGEFTLLLTFHCDLKVKDLRSFISLAKEAGWQKFIVRTFSLGKFGEESLTEYINADLNKD